MKDLLRLYRTHRNALLFLFGTWGVFFVFLFGRTLKTTNEGLSVIHNVVWSDWALHIGMASIFAYKAPQDWFSYHPIYADGKFTYGFLTNLVSGLLMRVGLPIQIAFGLPSILYSLLLLIGLYILFYLVLRSQRQANVAISLFFLSSGPGFLRFLQALWQGESLGYLLSPATQLSYSRIEEYSWATGSVVEGLLLPQRAFLLGMTMSVWALVGLLIVLLQDNDSDRPTIPVRQQNWMLGAAALLVGLLPITHMHSFIVLFMVTGVLCVAAYRRWFQLFFYYVAPTGVISTVLVFIFILGGIEKSDFIQWYPGWTADPGFFSWLMLWLRIWGLMLPVAMAGLFLLRDRPRVIQSFFAGFFLVFLVANLVLFQPVPWDNSKLFFWVYLGFSGLAAGVLGWLWQRGKAYHFSRLDTVLLALALGLTGAIELVPIQIRGDRHRPYISTQNDIRLGQAIRSQTGPLERFLTAPTHNHPVVMWGARPIILGYTAWAYNYGFEISQVEQDVTTMFQGGLSAENLLKQYQVSYVAIGPPELERFDVNEDYYRQCYPVALQTADYQIYDVRSLTQRP